MNTMRTAGVCLVSLSLLCGCLPGGTTGAGAPVELARNPIIWADVPDPSVIRVGDVFYMVSTTMHMNPGVPIMRSRNLVDWETVGYVYDELADVDALALRNGRSAYGQGSWASSIRYHQGTYYVVTFSNTTRDTYVFTTADIERGPWRRAELGGHFHDPSLLLDDDGRAYLIHAAGDIRITELDADARGVKAGGVDRVLIPNVGGLVGTSFYVPGEGSQVFKVQGRYYLFIIAWPRDGMRTQLVYRADRLEGPWEGRVVLQDEGIAQGGIVDTPAGEWYALLFGDRGAVGRIPYLVPVAWEEGWPVLGTEGAVPDTLPIPSTGTGAFGIVASDEFDSAANELGLAWQWNHNPLPDHWSLTARAGHLRLTTDRTDARFVDTRNTLTQRAFGPESSARIALDVSGLNDGDVAGLGLLQEHYAYVGVRKAGGSTSIVMEALREGEAVELERVPLDGPVVHLRVDADFREMADVATFFYSLDGQEWTPIGARHQLRYTLTHFMGARFALFAYATATPGGWADFDFFRLAGTADASTGETPGR